VVKLLKHTENILLKNKILEGWELIRINDGFSNVILAGLDGRVKLSLEPVKIGLTLHEKESSTSGKAGGLNCEPLKAVIKP